MGCTLCPRACGADRGAGVKGYCGTDSTFRIARAALHLWEEPCISVGAGSGTVFFCGCPLHCVYCQNRAISGGQAGEAVSPERLCEIFFELKQQGAANINCVTPTQYSDALIPVLETAREQGLGLPVVWNCGGYESVDALRRLSGLVDVYMPDFKYASAETAARYSHAPDYFDRAKAALAEMVRQHPFPIFEGEKLKKGVLVRHLVLPGQTEDSGRVLAYLAETYGDDILLSVMSQYTPPAGIGDAFPELARTVTAAEYEAVVRCARTLGLNPYTQQGEAAQESFIPAFDLTGVRRS